MKIPISLTLFIGGLVCFVPFFSLQTHPKYFCLLGGTAWVCAYWCVLAQNYKEKAPIPTRNQMMHYERHPYIYKFFYLAMSFIGVVVLFVLLIFSLSN